MKNFLVISLIAALSAIATPSKAGTSEELKAARKEKKELCMTIPDCKAGMDQKREARQAKALTKIQAEIAAMKR